MQCENNKTNILRNAAVGSMREKKREDAESTLFYRCCSQRKSTPQTLGQDNNHEVKNKGSWIGDLERAAISSVAQRKAKRLELKSRKGNITKIISAC